MASYDATCTLGSIPPLWVNPHCVFVCPQVEDDNSVIDLEKHLGQVERPFKETVTR